MTSHHFNIETIGVADTFAKLAAKGKLDEPSLTQHTSAADINASNEASQ